MTTSATALHHYRGLNLIEVLMLHRHLRHDQVVAGLAAALNAGALTADAVALEAREHGDTTEDAVTETSGDPLVS